MQPAWYIYCLPKSSSYWEYYVADTFPAPHGGFLAGMAGSEDKAQAKANQYSRAPTDLS
jgi:hypothetical protein